MKTVEPLELKLPLHQAEVVEPKVKTPAPAAEPVVITAIPKDAMVMEANQVKAGLTRFLNGTWRAFLDVQDPLTGKPPSLRYQIQNNKGFARVVHGDNIVCRVDVFSGLYSNGELLIKTRGNARCTDGSRYPMPEVTCKGRCQRRGGMHRTLRCQHRRSSDVQESRCLILCWLIFATINRA